MFQNYCSNPSFPNTNFNKINNNYLESVRSTNDNDQSETRDFDSNAQFPILSSQVAGQDSSDPDLSNAAASLSDYLPMRDTDFSQERNLGASETLDLGKHPLFSELEEQVDRNISTPYWQQTIITDSQIEEIGSECLIQNLCQDISVVNSDEQIGTYSTLLNRMLVIG